MRFLLFRLHGPMASWGEVAVGERRPSSDTPTRSAVLGLVAAALGLRRDQDELLTALFDGYGFACRVDAPGTLLVDYHTAQVAPEQAFKKRPPPSVRAEELAFPREDLSTMLSTRDYRCDALATACLWARGEPPWSLEQLRDALRRPAFVLSLGRKSCPLDLPLSPRLVEATHPARALAERDGDEESFLGSLKEPLQSAMLRNLQRTALRSARLHWEVSSADTTDPQPHSHRRQRRDDPRSRTRWQFREREELMAFAPSHFGGDHEQPLSVTDSTSAGGQSAARVLGPVPATARHASAGLELLSGATG